MTADGQLERDRLAHVDPIAIHLDTQGEMAHRRGIELGWLARSGQRQDLDGQRFGLQALGAQGCAEKIDTRNLGFERADGQASWMKREERLFHQGGDQIGAPLVGLFGQGKPGVWAGRGPIFDPKAVGAGLGGGAVLVLPLGEIEGPFHRNLVADVGLELVGLDAEKVAPAPAWLCVGRGGIVVHAKPREGQAGIGNAEWQPAARTTGRLGLGGVNHSDGDLLRAEFSTVHPHARRTDAEAAAVERQNVVVPAVHLAHKGAAAAHLHLGGLARSLSQGAKSAQVRRPIAVHAAPLDRQRNLQGERLADPDLGAIDPCDEGRLGRAGHARGETDHQPDDR